MMLSSELGCSISWRGQREVGGIQNHFLGLADDHIEELRKRTPVGRFGKPGKQAAVVFFSVRIRSANQNYLIFLTRKG